MSTNFRKRWYLFIPLILAGFVVFGFITMYLWNWLMPAIFHLPELNFWQITGLMVLSRLLLGFGCHRGPRHDHFHSRMHDKWEKMTPEEREQFRERMRECRPSWLHPNNSDIK